MPKVRASSGTIGTTNLPMRSSLSSFDSNRTNAMVVATSRSSPLPAKNSSNTLAAGGGSGSHRTRRSGTGPPSAARRSRR